MIFTNIVYSASPSLQHPFYVGFSTGFGSTTWGHLVPTGVNLNEAMLLATPLQVKEGGELWGVLLGYEMNHSFGLEIEYLHYKDAEVFYDAQSLFSFEHDGLSQFKTKTETFSLMAKFMVNLANTQIRILSSAGPAFLHRADMIKDRWIVSPTFGLGLNYHFTKHIMTELTFNYTAGYGESEFNPAQDYMPFLFSGVIRINYKF